MYTPLSEHVDRDCAFALLRKWQDKTAHALVDALAHRIAPERRVRRDTFEMAQRARARELVVRDRSYQPEEEQGLRDERDAAQPFEGLVAAEAKMRDDGGGHGIQWLVRR